MSDIYGTERLRHVIGRTVFLWTRPSQVAIWYPWRPKYGNPVRPLFSAVYSNEAGHGDWFNFQSQEDFAEFCEAYAASHPYLIEDSEPTIECEE